MSSLLQIDTSFLVEFGSDSLHAIGQLSLGEDEIKFCEQAIVTLNLTHAFCSFLGE